MWRATTHTAYLVITGLTAAANLAAAVVDFARALAIAALVLRLAY
ncbi:hypothetical protein GCM10009754_15340 [Amycolatopsis minnesotensis]|uniref:Uncharacterized protein n=1 Tax=Amycolatopsis minnesotensis TaxID=337894 RepID=A0ABN2QA07_9PSEU